MSHKTQMRVLIAEDQSLVRQGIVALLSAHDLDIVEIDNGIDALALLKAESFDIALLDIGLPGLTGLDVLKAVRAREDFVKIIILTGDTNTHSPAHIYDLGADGFLYKTTDADQFLNTFNAVAKGRPVTQPETLDGDNMKEIAALRETLTDRELQIVKLLAEGGSNKEVAKSLFISEHTVRKHREHINRKLSIRSSVSLAVFAVKAGLI
jgi:DNA-binding NarL/FixJ family response regulator